MVVKLEETFISNKLEVGWDLSIFVDVIVTKPQKKDLTKIQSLELQGLNRTQVTIVMPPRVPPSKISQA